MCRGGMIMIAGGDGELCAAARARPFVASAKCAFACVRAGGVIDERVARTARRPLAPEGFDFSVYREVLRVCGAT